MTIIFIYEWIEHCRTFFTGDFFFHRTVVSQWGYLTPILPRTTAVLPSVGIPYTHPTEDHSRPTLSGDTLHPSYRRPQPSYPQWGYLTPIVPRTTAVLPSVGIPHTHPTEDHSRPTLSGDTLHPSYQGPQPSYPQWGYLTPTLQRTTAVLPSVGIPHTHPTKDHSRPTLSGDTSHPSYRGPQPSYPQCGYLTPTLPRTTAVLPSVGIPHTHPTKDHSRPTLSVDTLHPSYRGPQPSYPQWGYLTPILPRTTAVLPSVGIPYTHPTEDHIESAGEHHPHQLEHRHTTPHTTQEEEVLC